MTLIDLTLYVVIFLAVGWGLNIAVGTFWYVYVLGHPERQKTAEDRRVEALGTLGMVVVPWLQVLVVTAMLCIGLMFWLRAKFT